MVRRCVHAKETTSPMDDMRSSGCTIGVCLAHSHPHGIGALRAAQRGPVLWRRARAFRASVHGTHDALNVARTPRLKRTRTENGLAKTEPSTKAAVARACRYAYARMRTPRWQMRYI